MNQCQIEERSGKGAKWRVGPFCGECRNGSGMMFPTYRRKPHRDISNHCVGRPFCLYTCQAKLTLRMSSDSDALSDDTPKRRKRLYVQTTASKEVADRKAKRRLGVEYVTAGGRTVPAKLFIPVVKCCIKNCYLKLEVDAQETIFNRFYSGQGKPMQDVFLASLIKKREKKRVVCGTKKKNYEAWSYSFESGGGDVCLSFFLSLFSVSRKRIRVIQKKILDDQTFEEVRGSHSNRPKKIKDEDVALMKEHLQSIPHDVSHYCREKSSLHYFDDSNLNLRKLYELFCEFYKENTKRPVPMAFKTYFKLFQNMPFAFRRPKTDVCDYCTSCEQKLNENEKDPCKTEFQLHKRKVEKRKKLRDDYIARAKNDKSCIVMEFDYGQNYPVPKLNVSSQFYKRLLWLYCFNVHIFNDGRSFLYCYMENQGKKNTNSVISFVYDCLLKVKTDDVTTVVFLSDACGGQNKNIHMVRFSAWIARVFNVTVEHLYPVRGHSFSQCDRNFGLVRKQEKKIEIIGTAKPYLEAMVKARKNPSPFEVLLDRSLLKEWDSALEEISLKTPQSKSGPFKIQRFVFMRFLPNGAALFSRTFTAVNLEVYRIFCTQNLVKIKSLQPNTSPYSAVSSPKLKDIGDLMKFVDSNSREWLQNLLAEK